MISPALGRTAHRTLLQQCHARPIHCRGMAAAASGTFSYETSEAAGIKIASRDIPGPTAYLAVVAKAGTRYQPLPGLTEALEKFAFKVGMSRNYEFLLFKRLVYSFGELLANVGQFRAQKDCQDFESQGKLNYWGPSSQRLTPEKTLSLAPNFYETTSPIW
jgi:hypothetical protein